MAKLENRIENVAARLIDGTYCRLIGGTHLVKSGIVKDIKISKTGHESITIVQATGIRFKTLGKNVEIIKP